MNIEREYFDRRMKEVLENIKDLGEQLESIERKSRLRGATKYLDYSDARYILKISRRALQRIVQEKRIRFKMVEKQVRFTAEDINAYVEDNTRRYDVNYDDLDESDLFLDPYFEDDNLYEGEVRE